MAVAVGAGSVSASGRRFVCARGRRSIAVRLDCVNLQVWNGRHSRWERLIGSAVPVQGLLSAALGPSLIMVDVSERWERLIGSAVPVQGLLSAALGPSLIMVDVSENSSGRTCKPFRVGRLSMAAMRSVSSRMA